MTEKHKLEFDFLHYRAYLLVTRFYVNKFKKVFFCLGSSLRVFIWTSNFVILIILLIILTIINIRVESVDFTSAIHHVLVKFMNTWSLMHLKISHRYDPVPKRVIIFTIEFLVQSVHYMSTALIVECAAIISLEQRPLLPLKSSPVYLVFGALILPLSFHTDPHLVDVFIGADYLSIVLIVLGLFLDSFTIYLLLIVGAIVL